MSRIHIFELYNFAFVKSDMCPVNLFFTVKMRRLSIIHGRVDFEKFPAGYYEPKISFNRPVTWSGGFSSLALHQWLSHGLARVFVFGG